MTRVLVLYYSRSGSTRAMANLIAAGIESVAGCEAVLKTVPPVSTECESVAKPIPAGGDLYVEPNDLAQLDGLALGSPTRFGNMAAPMKYFLDKTGPDWLAATLEGKPASVFTSSSSLHGGQESTLLTMMLPLLHHGMVIVGIPFSVSEMTHTESGGTPYGASHMDGADHRPLSAAEKSICRSQGQRLAVFSQQLQRKTR